MSFVDKYSDKENFNQIYKPFCIFSEHAKKRDFRKINE